VIVGSAGGGFAGAIVLYETALGIGIATGPLVGSLLGSISWRGPFFGVTALMSIALIAALVLVKKTPVPGRKLSSAAPVLALRHRGLLTMGLTALLYNWGFFTVLGFAPFPMHLDTHQLGIAFTGWGVLVAIFAVFGSDQAVLIGAVVATGIFIGVNNTITTQAVMTVSPVERGVASSAYGFVRFIGGGLAPYVAGRMAERWGVHVPFYVAAASVIAAIAVLSTGHGLLRAAEENKTAELARPGHDLEAAEGEALAEEFGSAT
jgi:MFS transporter, ACDE family, multidrug resistance protein